MFKGKKPIWGLPSLARGYNTGGKGLLSIVTRNVTDRLGEDTETAYPKRQAVCDWA